VKKILLLTSFAVIVSLLFIFDLNQQLTLDNVKAKLDAFSALRDDNLLLVSAIFFSIYVVITAASLPGAVPMTLTAGALFGLLWGTLLVSFASSLGATLAFLTSRYLLRDTIENRFGQRLSTINAGIARDGAFYLFTLRLIPFPFFLINLLMGLTSMNVLTFYCVSQIGMLAGTLVYVNAGTQLAQLESVSGILSLPLIMSFALLGIFPLIAKKLVSMWQARRLYAQWQRPRRFDRNLVVIGAGAAGLVTAYIAATVKAKVTLVEAHKMGGDCLNYGCVPSKALIKSAKLAHQIRNAQNYGLTSAEPNFSFKEIMARVHAVIREIAPHDSVERYTQLGVDVKQGFARIINPWTVEISLANGTKEILTTRSIVIAAGASPVIPAIPGLDDVGYVTSDTLWETFAQLDEIPKRLVILGGGPIGTELAHALARLGAEVTQIERGDRILAREDDDVSALATNVLTRDGVTILTHHKVIACERETSEHGNGCKRIIVEHEAKTRALEFDVLICAVGRSARLTGFGLEELGIPVEKTVVTNEYLETLLPNIFAAGDVAGPYQFTHVAAHQAWYAAVNALFGRFKKFKVDYRVIPRTTFIDPEIARVGLNECEAKEKNIPYEVTRYGIDDLDRAIADSANYGFIKVLTVPGKDKILGVTIVGEHASDLLTEFVLAMKWGLGLNKILGTIHTYPTFAEANKYVAGEWKRAHAPVALLRWVERYHRWQRGE
jgi:pyruvate/2-oxoglutarate dehydrogenase complex dihydrolipoamide dehydrogenase (E3) component/uncharacterized membrane protein YdjX (TVP38/TMEM64 family)